MILEEKEEGKESFFQRMIDAAHRMVEKREKSPIRNLNKMKLSDESDEGKVFKGELTREGANFIESACNFLGYPENQVEGMFRVSGSTSAIKYLKTSIETGCGGYIFVPVEDVHNVTSLIKMFLRQLKEPILSKDVAFDIISSKINIQELEYLKGKILNSILGLMIIIDQNREITKMDLPNLALILGPSLFFTESEHSGTVSFGDTSESSELLLGLADQYKLNKLNLNQQPFYEINDLEELPTQKNELNTEIEVDFKGSNLEEESPKSEIEKSIDNTSEKISTDSILELKEEIKQIKKELAKEREERIALGALIIPQLRKTQKDLIEAFKAMSLSNAQEEKGKKEQIDKDDSVGSELSESIMKPVEGFSFDDQSNVQ